MPSWKLHRAIYEKLSREVREFLVFTPRLLDEIDRVIDALGEHDLGRRPDPFSFDRMLSQLWLEFGDVYDTATGRFLKLRDRVERLAWANKALWERYWLSHRYMAYIPDDVLVLATLHHVLDLCMHYLSTL